MEGVSLFLDGIGLEIEASVVWGYLKSGPLALLWLKAKYNSVR